MAIVEVGFSRCARALQAQAIAYGRNAAADLNYEFPVVGREQARAVAVVIPPLNTPQQIDAIIAGVPPQITTIPAPGMRVAIVSNQAAVQALTNMARQLALVNLNGTAPGTPSTTPFGALGTDTAGGTTSQSWLAPTPWPAEWIVRYDAYWPPGGVFNAAGQLVGGGGGPTGNLSARPGAGIILAAGEGAIVLAGHAYVYQPAASGALTAATRTETVLSLVVMGGPITDAQYVGGSTAPPPDGTDTGGPRALPRYGARTLPPGS